MATSERILIVEDDHTIREAIAFLLRSEGYGVSTAGNGLEGLQALKTGPRPCLVILDLMMPVMDGGQFVDELRKDPSTAHIPILILSGDGRVDEKAPSGVAGCLVKPIDIDVLLDSVKVHC